MLTLDQAKAHLKLDPADTGEDGLLTGYLNAVLATFRRHSKRRWPAEGEPVVMAVVDPLAEPVTYRFAAFVDPAVLSEDEQQIARQWLLLTLGHWYENRATVTVGVHLAEVPHTAQMLMNLIRTPTL